MFLSGTARAALTYPVLPLSESCIIFNAFRQFFIRKLSADPMLRHHDFRRFWLSTVLASFGEQISSLAIPLTAVLLLQATPAQMGILIALQTLPFALFSLPVGVWLDRRSKYPVLLWSEFLFGVVLAVIPISYWLGLLNMHVLYAVGFLMGIGFVIGGSASQVFLAQLVGREHLLDAQSKFAATDSMARLVGPGIAGMLVQLLTAPVAVLVDALAFMASSWNLRYLRKRDSYPAPSDRHPFREMMDGIKMVWSHEVLWPLAWGTALWQLLFNGYLALQILFATHQLGMSPGVLGAAQTLGGLGVLVSSMLLKPLSRRFGSGRTILIGLGGTGAAWLLLAMIPASLFGSPLLSALAYGVVVFIFDCSAMLYFMPYLALRLKLTPDAYHGRMVSTMRFMTVAAAPLGALSAGWIAEHLGVRSGLIAIAVGGSLLTFGLLKTSPLRDIRD
ncbi:MFS transporter [Collimonas fungivorans]|uniref:MFS transporter n=1 Tax=Collimonas fungivorans TaxID=158899 RepID=UPI003FA398AC